MIKFEHVIEEYIQAGIRRDPLLSRTDLKCEALILIFSEAFSELPESDLQEMRQLLGLSDAPEQSPCTAACEGVCAGYCVYCEDF